MGTVTKKWLSGFASLLLLHAAAPLMATDTCYWHGLTSDLLDRTNWTLNQNGTGGHPGNPMDLVDTFDDSVMDSSWKFIDYTGPQDAVYDETGGMLVLSGRGYELWGNDHDFSGVYRDDVDGDFDVWVKVVSMDSTHEWAKAGILVANDIDSLSAGGYSLVAATHGHGVAWDLDSDGDGATDWHRASGSLVSFSDLWVRIKKVGTAFSTYYREAESDPWVQIDSAYDGGSTHPNSEICLFVLSHDDSLVCTARFDNFTAAGALAGSLPNGLALRFDGTGANCDGACELTGDYTAASIDVISYGGTLGLGSHLLTCTTLLIDSGTVDANAATLHLSGDFIVSADAVFDAAQSTITVNGTADTQQIVTNGTVLNDFVINTSGATALFQDDLTLQGSLSIINGTGTTLAGLGGKTVTVAQNASLA